MIADSFIFQRPILNLYLFDGTGSRPHAEFADVALQCRTGGTGTGHHPVFVADDQLAVGADVKEEARFLLPVDVQLH